MSCRVHLLVDNRVRIARAMVPVEVLAELRARFEHTNPQHQRLKRIGIRFDWRKEPPVIRTWGQDEQWLSVPRGGMSRVREVLAKHGLAWRVDDRRTGGSMDVGTFDWPTHRRTLFSDQEDALAALIAKENCLLRAGTGSGKTTVALAAIARLKLPAVAIVWTGALFDQWVERVVDELGLRRRDVGIVRGSRRHPGPVTVAMQQSLARIAVSDPFWGLFGVVVFDEVQRAPGATVFASIDPFPARYRFGVSASESRADRKEFLTYDLFGGVAAEVGKERLVAEGRVLAVEVVVVPTGVFLKIRQGATTGDAWREMLDEMAAHEGRNDAIVRLVAEEVRKGEQVLVLSLRVEHCMRLRQMLAALQVPAGLMVGGDEYKVAFDEAKRGLRSGELQAAVGTVQAIGTGVDLPGVGRGVLTMPLNRQLFGQVAGRLCRTCEGKVDARLYYLLDPPLAGRYWPILAAGKGPLKVIDSESGEWADARHDVSRARRLVVPQRQSAIEESPWMERL